MANSGRKANLSQDVQSVQICISATHHLPKVVTLKKLTIWGSGMNHQKAERVTYQIGVQSFRSSSSAYASNLKFFSQLLFCPEQISAALSIFKSRNS
jgi:hypothetical protein